MRLFARWVPLIAAAGALSTAPRRMIDGHPVRVITHTLAEATEISVFTRDLTTGVAPSSQDALAGQLWPSARALATEVHARLLRAQPSRPTVVELGCGVGMVSLAAAAAGVDVVASDVDGFARACVAAAAADAGFARVDVVPFDLAARDALPRLAPGDWVVMSDVFVTPAVARAAARRCVEAVDAGARVFVGDCGRCTRDDFLAELRLGARLPSEGLRFRDAAELRRWEAARAPSALPPLLLLDTSELGM